MAILQEFKCFSSDPKKPGFYRFDPSRTGRNSLPDATPVVQAPQPEPTGVRVEPEEVREEPVPVAVAGIPVAEIKVDATQVIPVKPVSKKREKRRRAEDTELPEHLMRLKAFERKLPGLESVKSLVVKPTHGEHGRRIGAVSAGRIDTSDHPAPSRKAADADLPVLLEVPAFPKTPEDWSTASFVNPERGGGHADLNMTLEVLKVFASRTPQIRKTDGSIVLFLDSNDLAVYFRIPPENPACWIAWISETDLRGIEGGESFLHEGDMKAKNSQKGFWWSTQKFRGPRGNWKDRNVLEGVQIVAKIIDLVERKRKS